MARNISMNDILFGINPGRSQSVGNMEIIPLISESRDEVIDGDLYGNPDDVEMGTSDYGSVNLRNSSNRFNFVPPGAGWVVSDKAQDHAIGGGELLGPSKSKLVRTARCIQPSQGGTLHNSKRDMLILPIELRGIALAKRNTINYSELWDDIGRFNYGHGISGDKNLARFIKDYKRQMDLFVAEFELVENQIGAIIMMSGKVIGLEIAPTRDYWKYLWTPLIRVCYGSLAVHNDELADYTNFPTSNREPLNLQNNTLHGIKDALFFSEKKHSNAIEGLFSAICKKKFLVGNVEQSEGSHHLFSGIVKPGQGRSNIKRLNGQVVVTEDSTVPFFSACGI